MLFHVVTIIWPSFDLKKRVGTSVQLFSKFPKQIADLVNCYSNLTSEAIKVNPNLNSLKLSRARFFRLLSFHQRFFQIMLPVTGEYSRHCFWGIHLISRTKYLKITSVWIEINSRHLILYLDIVFVAFYSLVPR